jgi:8-oxo-dGTP pyrophosphatase MutT (NUDIX family)
MQTKIVHSYGIIPVHKTETALELLLIHMYGSAGGTHWTFPKGRPEAGETPLESALRECKEEAGLVPSHVYTNDPILEHYTFMYEGVQIEKTVTFFVGIIDNPTFTIQPEEIKEAAWLPLAEVSARLTYPAAQSVLAQAQALFVHEGLI